MWPHITLLERLPLRNQRHDLRHSFSASERIAVEYERGQKYFLRDILAHLGP
jgi:hypothetical protein